MSEGFLTERKRFLVPSSSFPPRHALGMSGVGSSGSIEIHRVGVVLVVLILIVVAVIVLIVIPILIHLIGLSFFRLDAFDRLPVLYYRHLGLPLDIAAVLLLLRRLSFSLLHLLHTTPYPTLLHLSLSRPTRLPNFSLHHPPSLRHLVNPNLLPQLTPHPLLPTRSYAFPRSPQTSP